MKKRERKILAFLVAVVIILSIAAIMLLTPAFNISEIKVHGNSVLKDEQVIKLSGIEKGENIFSVSLKSAKDKLKSHAYVESVKIKRFESDLPPTETYDLNLIMHAMAKSSIDLLRQSYITSDGDEYMTADGQILWVRKPY